MASLTERLDGLRGAKTLVLKIGSALLVDATTGRLKAAWLHCLAEDVAAAHARGSQVVLVSSGSIALGRQVLGWPRGPLSLEKAQAAAAVGQIRLARAWEEALATHAITTAQVLVTLEDSADRRRYLNSRATLAQLLAAGAVPIVNENDTVATDEIRFGDNDRLAAQVAVTVGADHLILLSDVDGLYSDNPQINSDAEHFEIVREITPEIEAVAGEGVSGLSKGGMKTKIMAAKTAMQAGCAMLIAQGAALRPIQAILDGARASWFIPQTTPQAARKAWIASMKCQGVISVDAGAANALTSGKSLLPAGVSKVSGRFHRGDPVEICTSDGRQLGVGLAGYSAVEAEQIAGHKSAEISEILGYDGRAALIHRDDMALQ
ncbi:glutamate 5-kinase [Halocynthiibacter namhaensis]|uniref:glutamate 5-kinase n=1 Tax=Halocynthiibacter namhaensis TaxID=1290553 RepID=UPI0005797FAC|nr:glutamate 5-kinase [Halocynthiibacter namhaensis]